MKGAVVLLVIWVGVPFLMALLGAEYKRIKEEGKK